MHPFLRSLADSVAGEDPSESSSSSSEVSLDPKVFWPVNAFIFLLVVGACVFYCHGGFDCYRSARNNPDETYQERLRRREEEAIERRRGTPEQRKRRLLRSFQRCKVQMVVEESDLVKPESGVINVDVENPMDEDDVGSDGYLVLRGVGENSFSGRQVPNCCAICLGDYEVGDRVVWSSNAQCQHAFHMDCLIDWLTKMRDGTPCPCCRAEFTDLQQNEKDSKITWRPGRAFDFGRVTFSG